MPRYIMYRHYINRKNRKKDRRVDDWIFISSPLHTLVTCFIYIMIVKFWGPNYMKNRSALPIRNLVIIYNFLQVLSSAWNFIKVVFKILYLKKQYLTIDFH